MHKTLPFVLAFMLCCLSAEAQTPYQFSNPLNSVFPKLDDLKAADSELASSNLFDAYAADQIYLKLTGNEDCNKVMLTMSNQTAETLDLYLPSGVTSWRNPCTADIYYHFYTPEQIDVELGQSEEFILVNQAGTVLIVSGSVLFTDVSCSYQWLTTLFTSYYDPIPDDSLQMLLPFSPDTSTLQQVVGDSDGYLLVERNYDVSGMKSRYIYLNHAEENELYPELTKYWNDEAFESLTTHDFIVETENDSKILRSVEVPTLKITNTGLQGASYSVFTIIIERDLTAPELTVDEDTLYQPALIEVSSTEDGIIYLVPEDTEKNLFEIRESCLDSVPVVASTKAEISLDGFDNGVYWLYGRDEAGNVSEPLAFAVTGVGIASLSSGQIGIFPNPAGNVLIIRTGNAGPCSVELSTLTGRIILNRQLEGDVNQMDLSSIRSGIYLVRVRTNGHTVVRKMIKQ